MGTVAYSSYMGEEGVVPMIVEVEIPDDRVEELQRMLDNGEYVGQRWDDLAEYIGDKALHKVVRL